jgi:uncharacterized damage-inducible protein DinB
MPTVQDFLRELENETPATGRALERVPKDKLDWAPHERSLTMGQLARHIANIPGALPASVEQVLTTLDESVAKAKAVIGSMDDAALATPYHHRGQLTVYLRETGAKVPSIYGASADETPGG